MIERIKYIANIVIVVLLFAVVAIQRDGKVAGHDVATLFEQKQEEKAAAPIETTLADGTRVISSTALAKDVIGYGGTTPIKIFVRDGIIERIEPQPNNETPSFWQQVEKSGLLAKWDGMSLEEATTASFDAVSGATFSSTAVVQNVQRAAQYGAQVAPSGSSPLGKIVFREIAGLLVILLGAVITLAKIKSKVLLTAQLALNVVVLGFWCGSFLSLSTFTTWIGSGVNLELSLVAFALFIVALIMPLFGRKGSYCHLHCPMGSAQELLWKVPFTKIKINPSAAKVLNNIRYYILAALLFVMWLGVGFEIMDYEIFSAFIISSASNIVLILASIFLTLSLFVHRPYCKYVCPTGALITMTQKSTFE